MGIYKSIENVKKNDNNAHVLSIIIPVYNTVDFLYECFDSVINQKDIDIEIIAIDDGSTDGSTEIIRAYEGKYSFFKAIYLENNQGVSVARNKGLSVATGKYIGYLDSDDYVIPNKYSKFINICEKNNLDLIRFSYENFLDNKHGKIKTNKKINVNMMVAKYESNIMTGQELLSDLKNKNDYVVNVCLWIVKRSLIEKNNIRFLPGIIYEDAPYIFNVVLKAKKCMCCDTVVVKRRIRNMSIEHRPPTPEKAFGAFKGIAYMIRAIQNINWENDDVKEKTMLEIKRRYLFSARAFIQLNENQKNQFYSICSDSDMILFQATILPYVEIKEQMILQKNELKEYKKEIKRLKKKLKNIRNSKTFKVGKLIVGTISKIKKLVINS